MKITTILFFSVLCFMGVSAQTTHTTASQEGDNNFTGTNTHTGPETFSAITATGNVSVGGTLGVKQVNGTPFADQYASGGSGTCVSPWTSASGTGGISEAQAASSNGRVHLRQGVYAITSAYAIPAGTIVQGDGWKTALEQATFGNVAWTCSAVSGTVLLVTETNNALAPADNSNNISIQDLFILGPGSGTSSGIITSIPGQNMYIDNVMVANFGTGYNFNGLITHKFGRLFAEGDNTCMNVSGVTDDVTIAYRNFQGCGTASTIAGNLNVFHIQSGLVQSNTNGENLVPNASGLSQIDIAGTYYENNTNYALQFDGTTGVIQRVNLTNNHTSGTGGTADKILFAGAPVAVNDFTFIHDDFRGSDIAVPATANGWTMIDSQFKSYTNASNRSVTRISGDAGVTGQGTISTAAGIPIISESGVGLIDGDGSGNINIGRHGSLAPANVLVGTTKFRLFNSTFTTVYLDCVPGGNCNFQTGEVLRGFSDAGVTQKWSLDSSNGAFSTVGQITSTLATGTAPFVVASTTPVANLTVSNHPTEQNCGTTTTCSATADTGVKIVRGSAPLVSGTPSAATVTGFSPAFTSSSTFVCTVSNATTQANPVKVANASASSITITGPNTVTDTVNYICIGT